MYCTFSVWQWKFQPNQSRCPLILLADSFRSPLLCGSKVNLPISSILPLICMSNRECGETQKPEWMCIVVLLCHVKGQFLRLWQRLSSCGEAQKDSKVLFWSKREWWYFVQVWLRRTNCPLCVKASNYSFLLLDVYSLTLLVSRRLLQRLGNSLTSAKYNKRVKDYQFQQRKWRLAARIPDSE